MQIRRLHFTINSILESNKPFLGNTYPRGDNLEHKENLYQMGSATYVIKRVFTQSKTPQDVVVEEIITTAKQGIKISHSAK